MQGYSDCAKEDNKLKDLYYIGEAAEILNISTQTLRYYDKIGILQPAYTDSNTGYRKYTYDQVSYADRIRHLQGLGLNLEEIHSAIQENDVNMLIDMLLKKAEQTRRDMENLSNLQKELEWYVHYYRYIPETKSLRDLPFISREGDRYLLAEPVMENDATYGIGHKLMRRKNSNAYKRLTYLRQNGYLLDYEKLRAGELAPTNYFVMLREKPAFENQYIKHIPAGIYFCLRTKLLSEPIPAEIINQYIQPSEKPPVVIANEYEDNFIDFKNCPYELQILITPEKK